jgi:peptide/nickel transport system substrate-binding protein
VLLAVILAITGCSIQVRSEPDPTIPRTTLSIAGESAAGSLGRNFSPFLATNRRMGTYYIYEPLAVQNGLNGELTPWLSDRWSRPNAHTIDFHIRADVSWSDGKPFTAADVVYTFKLLKKYPALDAGGDWQHLKSVRADGDHVIMDLKTDDAPALSILAQTLMVPQHIWSQQAHPDTWDNPNPVGTGPFMLKNFALRQYTLDRNPQYWQADKIKIKQVLISSTASDLDIVTKGYDWAYAFMSDVDHVWKGASPHNQYWFPPAGNVTFLPNLTKKPFNNLHVRQGISLALNRSKIASTASEGTMQGSGQTGLVLPNQKAWLNPDIPDQGIVQQDKQAALKAFAKAGYTMRGKKLVDKDGKQLSFKLEVPNGYSDWLRAAQEVVKQLGALGIAVKLLQPQPAAQQLDLNNGHFEAAISSAGGADLYTAYNNTIGSEFYQPVGKAASGNFGRYQNAEASKLIAQLKKTTDPARQKKIGYRLQKIFYDDLPMINLYYAGLWGLFSDAKYTGWPTAKDPYAAPQNYTAAALVIFTHLTPTGAN